MQSTRADGAAPVPSRQLSTGFRLFLILSVALFPLALVAFLATLQSNRTADLESRAQMRVALTESVRQLGAAAASDIAALRNALKILETRPDDAQSCERLASIYRSGQAAAPRFALFGASSAPVCASRGFRPARPGTIGLSGAPAVALDEAGLNIIVGSAGGGAAGVLGYDPATLTVIAAPGGFADPYSLVLSSSSGGTVPLIEKVPSFRADYHVLSDRLGLGDLEAEMKVARHSFSAAELLSLMLPLLMWIAAAAIGWFVVNRLLMRPLRQLDSDVSAWRPGENFAWTAPGSASAQELNQLGRTFEQIAGRVTNHENELSEGLARQTKLTREVHHRVKNNLQVIASLINLHARGQSAPEVMRAYASIQRRVDALAVVHRNHFAELEVNHGVSLRALIGELAQNFRGSLPEGEPAPAIALAICPCYATQDIAVPIAFLLTELIELSIMGGPRAPITIALTEVAPGKARLGVRSPALAELLAAEDAVPTRFARVLEGLSRQLRTPLERDPQNGSFSLQIPITSDSGDED